MKDSRTITIGLRLSPQEKEELDQVVEYYKSNQSSILRRLIQREYQLIAEEKPTCKVL